MNPEVIEYIRNNRETYTAEAISQRLLDEGYTQEEVDDAWLIVQQQDAGGPDYKDRAGGTQPYQAADVRGTAVSADIKLLYVIVVATGLSFVQITDMVLSGNAEVVVNVGSVAAGVGLLVASLMLLRRGWPTGRVSVVILVFGIFWYLVILSTCLYGSRVLG